MTGGSGVLDSLVVEACFADFSGANLARAVFTGGNLTEADFTGAELRDAKFDSAKLDALPALVQVLRAVVAAGLKARARPTRFRT